MSRGLATPLFLVAVLLCICAVASAQYFGHDGDAPIPGGVLHFWLKPPQSIPKMDIRAEGRLGFNYISPFSVSNREKEDSECYLLDGDHRVVVGHFHFEEKQYKIDDESEVAPHTHLIVSLESDIAKNAKVKCDLRLLSEFDASDMPLLELQLVEGNEKDGYKPWWVLPDPISFRDHIDVPKWEVGIQVDIATGLSSITIGHIPENTVIGPITLGLESGTTFYPLNEESYWSQLCGKPQSGLHFLCDEDNHIYIQTPTEASSSYTFDFTFPDELAIKALPVGSTGLYNYTVSAPYFRRDSEQAQSMKAFVNVTPPTPQPIDDSAFTASIVLALGAVVIAILF
jgi:hypothetical protein